MWINRIKETNANTGKPKQKKKKRTGENGLCVRKNKLIDEIDVVGHMAMELTQKWKTIQRRKITGENESYFCFLSYG